MVNQRLLRFVAGGAIIIAIVMLEIYICDFYFPWLRYSDRIMLSGFKKGDDWTMYLSNFQYRRVTQIIPKETVAGEYAWSSDGKKLAYVYQDPDGEEDGIGVLESGKVLTLYSFREISADYPLSLSSSDIAWSPDNRFVLSNAQNGFIQDLFLLDTTKGVIRSTGLSYNQKEKNEIWYPIRYAWSVRNVLAVRWAGKIYFLDLKTGKMEYLADGEAPFWTPDGEWLTFVCEKDDLKFCQISSDGKQRRIVNQKGSFSICIWGEYSWSPDGRLILFKQCRGESDPYYISVLDTKTGMVHRVVRFRPDDDVIHVLNVFWPPRRTKGN